VLLLLLLLLLLLQSEERRNRALQPYRVTTPSRGIIGNSKYADRLRRQVRKPGTLGRLGPRHAQPDAVLRTSITVLCKVPRQVV
jgi:hypothetical protein